MLPERHYGRRRGRNVSRETFRPSKKLPYFLSHKKIPMGCSLNHPIPLQKRLSVQKLFPAGFHRKAREFPGDDPGKPDQRACIPEADRLKGFLCFQNAKAKELQLFPGNIQILLRKGKRRCRIQKKLHQIPVVLRAYLLRQENAAGFTHTLAPVLDISRDARMGRQGETYGEDPVLAAAMGTAYTRGIQESGLEVSAQTGNKRYSEAVAKHFMGFHNSEGGIHGADSRTPRRLLEEIYGKPFQAAIREASLRGVMPCYCTFDGEPASASPMLLTERLREEMGFAGVVITDGLQMQAMTDHYSSGEIAVGAVKAGVDILLCPKKLNEAVAALTAAVESGEITEERIDESVLRILRLKQGFQGAREG